LLELYIRNCPKLGKLAIKSPPSLKVLSIASMDSVMNISHEFYGEGYSQPFEYLETLCFESMKEWENWIPNGEFRHLCELFIRNSPNLLAKSPNHFSLLKKVVIEGCQQFVVSISSFPNDCELQIEGSTGIVCKSKINFSSLNMSSLSTIS
jgi:hypothetical protein